MSASGVPKIDGGFGLGLNFIESPSPQSQPRKAAIAPEATVSTLSSIPILFRHSITSSNSTTPTNSRRKQSGSALPCKARSLLGPRRGVVPFLSPYPHSHYIATFS